MVVDRCTMFECIFLWEVKEKQNVMRGKECTLLDHSLWSNAGHCFRHRIFQCWDFFPKTHKLHPQFR